MATLDGTNGSIVGVLHENTHTVPGSCRIDLDAVDLRALVPPAQQVRELRRVE